MENRENARYIVLANVNGKKTAIQLDGIYSILPPQNIPAQTPKEIQYKDERLPLFDAKKMIEGYEKRTQDPGSYERLYRDLLVKVKEISDEIVDLKKNIFSSMEQELNQTTPEKIPVLSAGFSSILTTTEDAAKNVIDLKEKIQEGQSKMAESFNIIKETLENFKEQEDKLLKSLEDLDETSSKNDSNLTNIVTSLTSQERTGQKLQKIVKLQDDMENKLISILFNFGIKLRREENPDDETIKRGEKMLDLLQGEAKEEINQEEVEQLLGEFLK